MTDQREQQSQQQQQQQHQQQHIKSNEEPRTNLIINYLPQSMTEKDLYSLFVTIGPVESCRVMKDYKTGYSYGFGFVNYAKAEDAATAINTLNGLQVQNKRLKVSFARPSGEEIKETNLYVTNLPRNITESQIDDIFSKYGNIVQKNILKDKLTGLPRGVAFVRFDKREEAQEAITRLHGTIPEGGSEPLSVKIAEEHGKQKAAYYAGWQAGYNQSRVVSSKLLREDDGIYWVVVTRTRRWKPVLSDKEAILKSHEEISTGTCRFFYWLLYVSRRKYRGRRDKSCTVAESSSWEMGNGFYLDKKIIK
ncbi:sex-lethal homolog isoform X3 [Hylaeus anthracinus]|nr:sex-lethal homolog isoform X3 [Hylaeus anthracinus]XP_054016438.1 sex-lethal homolog isoform X3 [Hylaeus anthracinus]XP_054016439.1 sex-lethal homolog isoform X3 [Hylaeus anthracinus]